jgi:signal transduction histidine kinase
VQSIPTGGNRVRLLRALVVGLIVFAVFGGASWIIQARYRTDVLDQTTSRARAEAEFVASRIEQWRAGLLAFAASQGDQASFGDRVQLLKAGDEFVASGITDRLQTAMLANDYDWIALTDETGRILARAHQDIAPDPQRVDEIAEGVLLQAEPVLVWPSTEIFEIGDSYEVAVAARIISSKGADAPAGALVFSADLLGPITDALEPTGAETIPANICVIVGDDQPINQCTITLQEPADCIAVRVPVKDSPLAVDSCFSRSAALRIPNQIFWLNLVLVLAVSLAATFGQFSFDTVKHQRDVEAQARRRVTEALEAEDRFLANMSHEFRTPLNSIIGFSTVLLSNAPGELNDEQRKQLKMIRRSGDRMLALVNNVLDLGQVQTGRVHPVASTFTIEEMAGEIAHAIHPLAVEKGLTCECATPPGETMHTDRHLLERVILNLLDNAVKYTTQGVVSLAVESQADLVVFRVTDSGPGIDPAMMPRLTEAYYRAERDRTTTGTGLGLTISTELAHLLGGEITIDSTPGVGSTFTLTVPRNLPQQE